MRCAGEKLEESCGGRGFCGGCRISVLSGHASPHTESELRLLDPEELARGVRLACQARPAGDVSLRVEPAALFGERRILTAGPSGTCSPEPAVRSYDVRVTEPSLEDLRGHDLRVTDELRNVYDLDCERVDLRCVGSLAELVRRPDQGLEIVVRDREIIGVYPLGDRLVGMAVDLGTTGTAGYLCDLTEGRIIAAQGAPNPQISYGEDVITRIDAAMRSSERSGELKTAAAQALAGLARDLSASVGCSPDQIADMVVVGNTAMHHLLLELPLGQLARAPHIPAAAMATEVKARDLGVDIMPGAYAFFPPNPAAFIGSDHLAVLLAVDAEKTEKPTLILDIGTNTEICLAAPSGFRTVSCASGPALEGGHISCGVRAIPGAVERVVLEPDGPRLAVIEDRPPVGLCGSGIVDICAELLGLGVVEPSGTFRAEGGPFPDRVSKAGFTVVKEGERGAVKPIVFTPRDVRNVQLAKAAIQTGIAVLLQLSGLAPADLDRILVAGAFGSYLNIRSALAVGLLPSIPSDRIVQVGNAAGAGAAMLLLSEPMRRRARYLSRELEYVELAAYRDFKETFMESIRLAPYEQ